VGWATADGLLRWHFVNAKRLGRSERLSPRFTWMAAKETDNFTAIPTTFIDGEGTSLKAALDIARVYGAVPDGLLPFGESSVLRGEQQEFYAIAAQRKVNSYFSADHNHWRAWIAHNGPVLARLDVDDTWMNATKTRGRLATSHRPAQSAGHAVLLVGYTP